MSNIDRKHDHVPQCEFCGNQWPLTLRGKCHLTAPLLAELYGDELVLRCYIPSCGREVARFMVCSWKVVE